MSFIYTLWIVLFLYTFSSNNLMFYSDKTDICLCGSPPSVTNANFNPTSGPYNCGTTVSYTCFSGYTLQGNRDLRCNSNTRQWDRNTPFCQRGSFYFYHSWQQTFVKYFQSPLDCFEKYLFDIFPFRILIVDFPPKIYVLIKKLQD